MSCYQTASTSSSLVDLVVLCAGDHTVGLF